MEAIVALAVNACLLGCAFCIFMANTCIVAEVGFEADGSVAIKTLRTFAFFFSRACADALCKRVTATMVIGASINAHTKLAIASEARFTCAHVLSRASLSAPRIFGAETVICQAIVLLSAHLTSTNPALIALALVGPRSSHRTRRLSITPSLIISLAIIDGLAQCPVALVAPVARTVSFTWSLVSTPGSSITVMIPRIAHVDSLAADAVTIPTRVTDTVCLARGSHLAASLTITTVFKIAMAGVDHCTCGAIASVAIITRARVLARTGGNTGPKLCARKNRKIAVVDGLASQTIARVASVAHALGRARACEDTLGRHITARCPLFAFINHGTFNTIAPVTFWALASVSARTCKGAVCSWVAHAHGFPLFAVVDRLAHLAVSLKT